ncbi:hypothetical protein [Micromonospora sp. HUAS LYJ1]|uniref:hypothetical protein n=1 Tax=Micromonospora sp. HUAS LYJ1 TaxID=3061626 RepID=UPI0026734809|nr:hypothetical protein [Micromonospora sp. HUAS LYJ1]WKU04602.1 hypothetical protein Q2K16_28045 [Micromonospora sp. HUAS LYJ1]
MTEATDPDVTDPSFRPVATMTTEPGRSDSPRRTVLLPRISTDPVDDLVERVRPRLARAVDALQVAAALEADGHTDRAAQVEYGYRDVFVLASEVFRRLGPAPAVEEQPAEAPGAGRDRRGDLRTISHGLLYVLPSAAFPAVLSVVGRSGLVAGMILAGTVGWVWSGVVAYAAFRLLGLGRARSASRVLRIAALTAVLLGLATGALMLPYGGLPLAAMMVCQLAYQLASTLLIFYRREGWLAAALVPAVLASGVFLVTGGVTARRWAVGAAALGVLAAFAAGLWATRSAARSTEPAPRDPLWPARPGLLGVAGYGLCSATLLFHAQAPYLLGQWDVAASAVPLILSMGFVEWRTSRFWANGVALSRRSRFPHAFVVGIWRTIGRELAVCLAVPAVFGVLLLVALARAGVLSTAGVVMTAAHVALAGAYYLAFLLVGQGRYGWLCLSMTVVIVLHVGGGGLLGVAPLLGQGGDAVTDTSLHLGSVLLLQGLFALGLVPVIGQVRHYR